MGLIMVLVQYVLYSGLLIKMNLSFVYWIITNTNPLIKIKMNNITKTYIGKQVSKAVHYTYD